MDTHTDRRSGDYMLPQKILGEHTNAPPNGGHVFQPTGTIFKLVKEIIGNNLGTKFHEDRTINVASRV
ncbi:hypothetical protein DPMN_112053 [Dreissena polymorpha]|uniref:Uncharacterized protein n=1 Tax=Dreissena polymorpha TaxID=45954 RepID=A0A9D4KFP8_DREPO|nr:hypothetical protein DPMN_112053 [Dreissena polymorpha]